MGAIRALALLTLIVGIMVHHANAQPSCELLRYYWVGPEEVWLWHSNPNLPQIKATYDQSNKQWKITPTESVKYWRTIFERVASDYHKDTQVKELEDGTLQEFTLAKLRNEYTQVLWARPYQPIAQLYVRPESDNKLKVILFSEGSQRQIFSFTKNNKNQWTRNAAEKFDLELFQVANQPAGLSKIFGVEIGAGGANEQWITGWDQSIKKILSGPLQRFTYTDTSKQQQWISTQVLGAGAADPPRPGRMPESLTPVTEPDISQTQLIPTAGGGLSYKSVAIVLLLLLFIVPLAVPRFRRRLSALVNSTQQSVTVEGDGAAKLKVTSHNLNELHRLALQRLGEGDAADVATRSLFVSSLEVAKLAYAEVAAEILEKEQEQNTQVLNAYRNTLGVSEKSDDDIRRWIILGQKAEELSTTTRKNGFAKEILERIGKQPKQSWSNEQWLALYPEVVDAYGTAWRVAREEQGRLSSQLATQQASHAAELTKREESVAAKSDKQVKDLQKQTKEQDKKITNLETTLTKTNTALAGEETKVTNLTNDLAAANTKYQLAEKQMKELSDKISQIGDIRAISINLRMWLQGYQHKLLNETREIGTLSVLSSLINFSVGQMCFGVVEGKEVLTKASAYNLLKVIRGFALSGSSSSLMDSIESKITKLVPDVKAAKDFGEECLGGTTYDQQVFREFLNFLKTDAKRDLNLFYIDLDKNEHQTLVHVTSG